MSSRNKAGRRHVVEYHSRFHLRKMRVQPRKTESCQCRNISPSSSVLVHRTWQRTSAIAFPVNRANTYQGNALCNTFELKGESRRQMNVSAVNYILFVVNFEIRSLEFYLRYNSDNYVIQINFSLSSLSFKRHIRRLVFLYTPPEPSFFEY